MSARIHAITVILADGTRREIGLTKALQGRAVIEFAGRRFERVTPVLYREVT